MEVHLSSVSDHDEPIAALWASESEIYGRFGFGRASDSIDITISRAAPEFSRHASSDSEVRVIDVDEARRIVPQLHESYRSTQPGMFARSLDWWEARVFSDPANRRGGYTGSRWVVTESAVGVDGYARYRSKPGVRDGHFDGSLRIDEMFAMHPRGWVSLWDYFLNHDMVAEFTALTRSPQDPIFDLLEGPRRAQPIWRDGLWIRVMDVPKALTARSYSSEFAGVIDVQDPMGISGGRFRLEATPEGASCTPTDHDPDITLDIEDLGAVYLGRPGFRRLARAGRLQGTTETLTSADLAFGWDPQPWCPEIF